MLESNIGNSVLWINRYERGYNNGYDRARSSRSPDRGSGRGDRAKISRERSFSPDRYDKASAARSPARSFHEMMMKRGRSPQRQRICVNSRSPSRERSRSPHGGARREKGSYNHDNYREWKRSPDGGTAGGKNPSNYGEEEEGLIPADGNSRNPPDVDRAAE